MLDNVAVVREYMNLVATGDLESALELAADDAVFQGPDGQTTDKAGLRAVFAMLGDLMPNPLEQKVEGITAQGDRVAIEATGRTMLANGNLYSNVYHFLFVVREGMIVRANEYCNTRAADAFGFDPA